VGDPPMNLLKGRIEPRDGGAYFTCGDLRVPLSAALAKTGASLGRDAPCVLGVRPNLVSVVPAGTPGAAAVELYSHEPFGKYAIVTVRLSDALIKAKTSTKARSDDGPPGRIGAAAGLVLPTSGFVLFDAASGNAVASDNVEMPEL
jgi:ABC-type sugar transport system ATPase subunit